jgi:hypothetical protein
VLKVRFALPRLYKQGSANVLGFQAYFGLSVVADKCSSLPRSRMLSSASVRTQRLSGIHAQVREFLPTKICAHMEPSSTAGVSALIVSVATGSFLETLSAGLGHLGISDLKTCMSDSTVLCRSCESLESTMTDARKQVPRASCSCLVYSHEVRSPVGFSLAPCRLQKE